MLLSGIGKDLYAAVQTNFAMHQLLRHIGDRWSNPAYVLSIPSFTDNEAGEVAGVQYSDFVEFYLPMDVPPFVRAQYLGWSGNEQQVQPVWQEMLERGQRIELAVLALGLLAVKRGDIPAALNLWNDRKNIRIADYLTYQGDYFLRTDEREEALKYYQLAKRLRPDELDLTLRITLVEIYLQEREAYLARLDKVLTRWGLEKTTEVIGRLHALVSDGFVWVFMAAADVYQQRQDETSAEKVLLLATQIHPGPVTYVPLGAFYCNRGRFPEGIAVLERAKPYSTQHYALLARQQLSICYCQAGLRDKAVAEAQELARMSPENTPFQTWDLQLSDNWAQLCEK